MKTNTWRIGLALLSAVLFLSMAVVAQADRRTGPGMIGGYAYTTGTGPELCLGTEFNRLSPEKQEAVSGIIADHERTVAALNERLDAKRDELKALRDAGAGNSMEAERVAGEIGDLNGKITAEDELFRNRVERAAGADTALMVASAERSGSCPVW